MKDPNTTNYISVGRIKSPLYTAFKKMTKTTTDIRIALLDPVLSFNNSNKLNPNFQNKTETKSLLFLINIVNVMKANKIPHYHQP